MNLKKYQRYLFLCCAVAITALSPLAAAHTPPVADKGVIDLRPWDFDADGSLPLNGAWEFYWDRLLAPADFARDTKPGMDGYFAIPGTWNRLSVNGAPLGHRGCATFRLTALMDGKSRCGIKLFRLSTAFRLFVNGAPVAAAGVVGPDTASSVPQYLPQVVALVPADGRAELVLQVSNFHHTKGGPREEIVVGPEESLRGAFMRKMLMELFVAGSISIMGLYHMILFLYRRRERAALHFGLFCFTISVWAVLNGELSLVQAFHGLDWRLHRTVSYLALCFSVPLFFNYVRDIFPRTPRAAVRFLNGAAAVYALVIIAAPISIYSAALPYYEIIILAAVAFVLFIVGRELAAKNIEAVYVSAGIVIYFTAVVNDILYDIYVIRTIMLGHLGLFAFFLFQSLLMARRFSRAFTLSERLSEDLRETNESLRELDRLKDEFLANTSHELRTPLSGMIGIAESLADGVAGSVSPGMRKNLDLVIASGRRLSNLVNDILDFSRLKHHDIRLSLAPVNVHSVAQAVLDVTRYLAGGKDIALVNAVDPGLPPAAADEARLEQVFHNLVGNSLKFTARGRIEVDARLLPGKGTLEIRVTDTGEGIAADRLARVFEPFEQADGSATRVHGGTGLGLSIVKRLVELHGGGVDIASQPGEGTRVSFTLPVADASLEKAQNARLVPIQSRWAGDIVAADAEISDPPAPFPPAHEKAFSCRGCRILAVDDDPVNLQVIANQLALHDYSVTTATGGADALELIRRGGDYDLVILDVMMPRVSGFEVAQAVRKNFDLFELPIIMLTARSRIVDIVTGFEAGANDYLTKPFHRDELLARVHTLIALKRAVKDNARLSVFESEIRNALTIQRSILPGCAPEVPGIDIAFRYVPMRSLGGDFFDFFMPAPGCLGAILTDVSGHGMAAALIASMVKIAFHFQLNCARDPATLLQCINDVLLGKFSKQFLTACYAFIDMEGRTISTANAGHLPLVIWKHAEQEILQLNPAGRLIGYFADTRCEDAVAPLAPGDRVILYTDGITESRNAAGEMFDERFFDAVETGGALAALGFIDDLMRRLAEWHGSDDFEDDITIVVIDIL
ncbi:MAG: response regulator [Spirochaetes bacterium]|nr:MAG: response regulator [Spirochaetota bacterium]